MANTSNLILALDKMSLADSLRMVEKIGYRFAAVKVNDLADEVGVSLVHQLVRAGAQAVWIDFKINDTKDTLLARTKRWHDAGARFISVHANAGSHHIARVASTGIGTIGITVLTDIDKDECQEIYGLGQTPDIVVPRLAGIIAKGGAKFVVSSGQEVRQIKSIPALAHLKSIVPGTRSIGKDTNDQKRVTTPKEAIDAGADFLVMGRQITAVPDQERALEEVLQEIA
jgi:orotidine-5'-phosphate decarboxylase